MSSDGGMAILVEDSCNQTFEKETPLTSNNQLGINEYVDQSAVKKTRESISGPRVIKTSFKHPDKGSISQEKKYLQN
jgi:hypothetical protein